MHCSEVYSYSVNMPTDNEKLELVFLKLGLAETDAELQIVVTNYLNPVLLIFATNEESIRTKVLELLAHLNKRLKARETIQLPVKKLLEQLNDASTSLFTKNFALTYIKTGFPRLTEDEQKELVPQLFASLEKKPKVQQDLLLRLIIESLPLIGATLPDDLEKFQFSKNPQATERFLEFSLDYLLLPYSIAYTEVGSSVCPAGLSFHAMQKLLPDVNTAEHEQSMLKVESVKIATVNFLKSGVFSSNEILCHLVVASADTKHTVASLADIEYRRLLSSFEWDSTSLNMKLYKLYLGQAGVHTKKPVGENQKREPADIRMKFKLITALTRSTVAGECFPQSIQVVYDGLFGKTNSKLQILTLQFIYSIIDRSKDTLVQQKQAPLLFEALIKVTKNDDASEDCCSMAYVGLGKLSKKFPKLFLRKIVFIQSLFDSLEKKTSEKIKDSIQETLIVLAGVYQDASFEDWFMLETLVESSIGNSASRLQFVGVHYATTVFPSSHVASRYQLLLALSQAQETAATRAHKCLFASPSDEHKTASDISLPSFSSMINYVYDKAEERVLQRKQFSFGGRLLVFPPSTFQAVIVYLRRCLLGNPLVEINTDTSSLNSMVVVKQIRDLLADTSNGFILINKYFDLCLQLLSAVTDAFVMLLLLEIIASSPKNVSFGHLFSCPSNHLQGESDTRMLWLRNQIINTNENIRWYAAEAYAIVVRQKFQHNREYADIFQELLQQLQSKNFELKHGSTLLFGYIAGDWLKLTQEKNETHEEARSLAAKAINILVQMVGDKKDLNLSSASCSALGEIARKAPLPLVDGQFTEVEEERMESDSVTKADVVRLIISCVDKNTSHQFRESLVLSLGRLPVGDSKFPFTEKILANLLETAEIKDVELHFSVGAALCSAALGVNSPERFSRWEVKEQDSIPNEKDMMEWLLDEILTKYVVHRIPAARQASAIWLMVMMKTKQCVEHSAVQGHLVDLHNAFQILLTEADDLTQDIASKGFGIVYNLADAELKKMLVDQLVDSLTGNKKTPAKVRVLDQEGASLIPGAAIQLGKAPDGTLLGFRDVTMVFPHHNGLFSSNLSTYKELCSLASDLNQPDLVYKFMQLANHHSQWNSKKGAAFGFRSIIEVAREELAPHLPHIVPRLYRYTFDPHPPIRAAMTSIWNVLAPTPQKTIHEHMGPILDDLLRSLTSSVWRSREASCLALNNLLQSGATHSSDAETRSHLLVSLLPELWKTLIRVADDIKESVRKAALDTCKRLQKVTIRLCDDPTSGITENDALSEVLAVLLNDGLTSKVNDVTKLSLSCLVEISKLHSKAVKPCLPQMIGKLLEALSGIESPMINYVHTRSSSGGQNMVDEIRIQAVKSHPLMETAWRCVEQCDVDVMKDVVSILVDLIKRAVGTLTKAGCSYAVRTLATSCKNEIEPHCSKLMSALLTALRDRSSVIRKLHAHTIGYLAPVASDETLEKMIVKMKQWYLEKEEESLHHGSAVVLQAIAHKSPDVLARHSALVLPLAFYGMHENGNKKKQGQSTNNERFGEPQRLRDFLNLADDKDMSVDEIWKSIWNEFTPGIGSALHMYFSEILELCSLNLQSTQWQTKIQAALALSYMIENQHTKSVVAPHLNRLVEVLFESLRGRVWEGKQHLVKALRDVAVNCASLMTENQTNQVIAVLLNESKRGKVVHRSESIVSLADTIHSTKVDRIGLFWDLVSPILQESTDLSSDSDEEDKVRKRNMKWDFKEKITKALHKPWNVAPTESREKHLNSVFTILCKNVEAGTHSMQLATLSCLAEMLPFLPQPSSSEKEVNVKKVCQSMVSPICTCIGDLKYLSTREAAFKVVQCLLDFTSFIPDEDLSQIRETLKSSSLNSNAYHDYNSVVSLLDKLKAP